MEYKVPLVMTPQPEGGYTVTSPVLPELVTEGDTLSEALHNAKDALAAVVELYEEDDPALTADERALLRAAGTDLETKHPLPPPKPRRGA